MTTITYQKDYRKDLKTDHWILYSDMHFKDSLIILKLYHYVKDNQRLSFNEMFENLKEIYKNKTEKSRCNVECYKNRIEVSVKGVFPRFYIEKI